ncbi:MAG: AAA family ATPase [Clostridium sp.]|nr:AAA family ATPase [Clostridium sp.]
MIGFNSVRSRFTKAIIESTLSHSHIIVGEDGLGKSILVEEVSREIMGSDRDSIDIVRIRPYKEKRSISVDQIREMKIEASTMPYEGSKKIFIIYNADSMSLSAQNAMLKTIEEPFKNVYFFLLSENEVNLEETIRSRCHIHRLYPLSEEEMNKYFELNYNIKDINKDELIVKSKGIPGKLDYFMENKKEKHLFDLSVDFITALIEYKKSRSGNKYEVLKHINLFNKYEIEDVRYELIYVINYVLKEKSMDSDISLSSTVKEKIEYLSIESTYNILDKYIDIIYRTKVYTMPGVNINKQTVLSALVLKLLEV